MLLKLISKFRKVAGYKTSIQSPAAFVYTNNELPGKEIKNAIPFSVVTKK
jgi:hypothetical protein